MRTTMAMEPKGRPQPTINISNSTVLAGRDIIFGNVYNQDPPPIDHALVRQRLQKSLRIRYEHYTHLERLFDNTRIPIADSFINLALIKETEYKVKEQSLARDDLEEKDDGEGKEKSHEYVDERMASHEQLYAVKEPLALTELFEPKDDTPTPNKILILGRAGIGKSILCQYLATQWASDTASFDTGDGADAKGEELQEISISHYLQQKFDAVFWLKLREVAAKTTERDTLLDVLDRFCLGGLKKDKPTQAELASYLETHTDRVLFILDGYDEITDRIEQPGYNHLNRILAEIASQQHVLLTSRPITIDTLGECPIRFDRRLENIGFLNENIEAYVHQFMHAAQKPKQAERMLDFLKTHSGIWGIAHIPINLELLSWLWSKEKLTFGRGEIITLAKLYETIVGQVQKAYIRKTSKRPIALALDDHMESKREDRKISTVADRVNEFLEILAYSAMEKETLFISATQIKIALEKTLIQHEHPSDEYHREQLLKSATDKLGFLRTAGQGDEFQLNQDHYFIHLSFQEFYAARYIARILSQHPHSEEGEQVFQRVLTEKYTPHYQLILWMSAGLLYQQGKKVKQFSALLRFWRAILSQPRDMIGFYHNVLVIHCLDECEADDCVTLHKRLVAQQQKWFEFYRGKYECNPYIQQFTQCSILLASFSMVTYLLRVSQNEDRRVRSTALKILACLKDPSEAVVKALLNTSKLQNIHWYNNRYVIATALGNLNNPNEAVIQALLSGLRNEREHVRSAIAEALGKLENPSAIVIKALLKASRDESERVRSAAAEALGKLENSIAVVIEALLRALRDESESVRSAAAEALGKLENPIAVVIEALLRALRDESERVRSAAVEALGKLEKPTAVVIEALLRALRDESERVRSAAAEGLAKLENPSKVVIGALLRALRDESENISYVLGKLNNPNGAIIEALLSDFRDESASVKSAAAQALGKLNNPSETVIEALLSGLRDESASVRRATTKALGNLNNPSEAVIEALLSGLRDESKRVRSAAAQALGKLENLIAVVIEALLRALRDESERVRSAAAQALVGKLNNPSEAVIEALLSGLRDQSKRVRSVAAQALGKLENPIAVVIEALLRALRDESERVRSAAAQALVGKLNNPSEAVIEALLSALWNEEIFVWSNAAKALGKLNNPSAVVIEALFSALRDERKGACYTLTGVFSTILSTPKTIEATTYIFNQLVRDEKRSLAYFSCWIEKHYLLLIDYKKGNIIARQEHQKYSISLPPSDLLSLEKQIIAATEQANYPPAFYSISGCSSDHSEKGILQSCKPDSSVCFVSDAMWLAHIVCKKIGQRTLLIVEGMAAEKHFVQCYEFTLSQRGSNASSGFFSPGGGIGHVVKTRNFLNNLKKDKESYQSRSWDIEPATGQELLQLLEAEVLSSKAQRHDCLAWAEAKLEAINLPIEGRWTDFTVALPAVAREKPVQAEKSGCRLM
jgi:HEAT repeat protein